VAFQAVSAETLCAGRVGRADIAGHVIECRLTEHTRVQNACDDVLAGNLCLSLVRHCTPRHMMSFNSTNEG